MVNNNPSRQSERSRYNNQDYQTYTPPSIVKDAPDTCHPSQISKLRRRASVNFRPDSYACDFAGSETLLRNKLGSEKFYRHEGQKTLADVKIKLNRRKSFHDVSNNPDVKFGRRERRKSVMDHVHSDKWLPLATEVIPEHQVREKQEKRSSNSQMTGETVKKSPSNLEKGILLSPENRCNRTGLNVSFNTEVLHSTSSHSHSPLVYLYETTGRKRKVFLPSTTTKMFERDDFSR